MKTYALADMNDLLCYIRGTLVPDLRESGRDATADDFEELCDVIEQLVLEGRPQA